MDKNRVTIYKIGGNVVDNADALPKFLNEFSEVEGKKVLVHGGGKIASKISGALGIEAQMIDGRRVTDTETLKIVTMVYAGLVNKTIVAGLQECGCNAIGLSGADGVLIRSKRRAATPVDFGEVGDPMKINDQLLSMLLNEGYVPVVAPITLSENSTLLNTNADTVAQSLAVGLSSPFEVELVYVFEKDGVLNACNEVIERIDAAKFEEMLKSGEVNGGMIPKIQNALQAIASGVKTVRIGATVIQ